MKTIKPQRLGLLTKTFENAGESYFVVSIFVLFPFESPRALLPEVELWKLTASELGREPLDMCMPKSKGELLITGKAYPRAHTPHPAVSVRAKIGTLDKTLWVVGNRRWRFGVSTDPEPFTEMPITWANAFGGEGFPDNPLGKGFAPVKSEGVEVHALPNVEDPDRLIRHPKDRPAPAGFGPFDLTWPQRFSKAGTYDKDWLDHRFPGFARDMDWAIFNTAPPDQQIEGYFAGDEHFTLENMHPDEPLIEASLPGVKARAFINQATPDGEVFREIATRIDTVRLFPHKKRGVLLFRGMLQIAEDDAADVLQIIIGCEDAAAPKPVEHYQAVLKQRLDRESGYLYSLRDSDLLPESCGIKPSAGVPDELAAEIAMEGLLARNLRNRAEIEREKAREKIKEQGLDPDEHLPPLPPPAKSPEVEDLPAVVAQATSLAAEQKAKADKELAEAEQKARKACAEHGIDFDKAVSEERKKAAGPPKFTAKGQLEQLRDMKQMAENGGIELPHIEALLADPDLERKLLDVERRLFDAYRRFAHYYDPAARRAEDTALREELAAGRAAGASFAGRDLTGADLSNLDLRGIDLRAALLEAADLTGSNLTEADLTGAVLARADLAGADLSYAKLAGANLGSARLTGARLDGGVDLTGAVLAKADLSSTNFHVAQLAGADLSEAVLAGADFTGVSAAGLTFLRGDLTGLKLEGADLRKCNFLETTVTGADFSRANLTGAVFVTCNGDRAKLAGARLENLRVVKDSSFAGADFTGAQLDGANLRGTNLEGADFTGAHLRGADLSTANLRGARLYRAMAVDARFVKSDLTGASLVSMNLMQSILQKANLKGADLRGANLFRADLSKIEGDSATNFEGAVLKHARVLPTKPGAQPVRTHEQG